MSEDKLVSPYPFYKANIHEKRAAAIVCRCLPLVLLLSTCLLLATGVMWHPMILLWITAVLNVVLWLWLVSTSLIAILGAVATQEQLRICEATSDGKDRTALESQDDVRHVIVVANYKEEESMLSETLQSLKEAEGSDRFYVVLAMEAREQEASDKFERLKAAHGRSFGKLLGTFHPANLQETHADGSSDPEVPGKASNLKFAVAQALKLVKNELSFNLDNSVLTIADADVFFHPAYFGLVGQKFRDLRKAGTGEHKWTLYQAPQLCWRNFWESPIVSRSWGYISSLYEFGGVSSLRYGGHHMVFSAYSVPMSLACEASLWDGDVIAEDHHAFLKSWFYSAFHSHLQNENEGTNYGISSRIKLQPVMLPVKATSVNSPDGYWASWIERWHQATRHTQGVAEMSYACLAAWDMLSTTPVRSWSLHFLVSLFKVVMKPIFMHILPTLQSIALGVLTLYWLSHKMHVPGCPHRLSVWAIKHDHTTLICGLAGAWALTWPIVIPFALLIVSNFLMLRVAFLQEASQKSLWHKSDGGVVPFRCAFGSKALSALCCILVDCSIFVAPIMGIYGFLPEIIAFWNVMARGNSFKYITASKALGQSYGSVEEASAPINSSS
jgi:hypothetical protein